MNSEIRFFQITERLNNFPINLYFNFLSPDFGPISDHSADDGWRGSVENVTKCTVLIKIF